MFSLSQKFTHPKFSLLDFWKVYKWLSVCQLKELFFENLWIFPNLIVIIYVFLFNDKTKIFNIRFLKSNNDYWLILIKRSVFLTTNFMISCVFFNRLKFWCVFSFKNHIIKIFIIRSLKSIDNCLFIQMKTKFFCWKKLVKIS